MGYEDVWPLLQIQELVFQKPFLSKHARALCVGARRLSCPFSGLIGRFVWVPPTPVHCSQFLVL